MLSTSSPPSTAFLHKPPLLFSLSTPRNLRFPNLPPSFSLIPSKSFNFPSHSPYDAVSQPPPPDDDDESAIGDCLVFEDGVFDDPFSSQNDAVSPLTTENLIPDEWLDVQKEINISKKERRRLAQELEYGKRVEKRRQALMPLDSAADERFERFKREKMRQLKPLVLDEPEEKSNAIDERRGGDEAVASVGGRVAPRNPRLAVYGGGLEDVSAVFGSGDYERGAAGKSEGTRKLFSKEEKMLMNRRVPDLKVAISGKWHPLHTLAASGEFYLVNSLLKHNLDINLLDKNGLAAIHKAILGKKQAIFNFLLRESANPFVRDNEGATLMHYAVLAASTHMIKILLLYNVDINLQDNDGWTPLHLAVQSRRADVVRLLLIKGADKSLKNRNGLTALDLCLYSGRDTRTYEIIKLLKLLPYPSVLRT